MDFVDLYDRASQWAASKVQGAADRLDDKTECEEWKARDLINHLLMGTQLFKDGLNGQQIAPPQGMPPELIKSDPAAEYEAGRQTLLGLMREGVAEDKAQLVGIAFADTLIHGWDLAKGTGQDATMPADLAEAAFGILNGRLTDETRGTSFKPKVSVGDDATTQDKLVAYTGRAP